MVLCSFNTAIVSYTSNILKNDVSNYRGACIIPTMSEYHGTIIENSTDMSTMDIGCRGASERGT